MIGQLRERMIFEMPISSDDGAGGVILSWQPTAAEIWAKVNALKGQEVFANDQNSYSPYYNVTIRWNSDIKLEWRIKWRNNYYNILSLAPNEKRSYQTIIMRQSNE